MVGSGIRKKPIPDPGSGGQKGTGSRIRIRNTAQKYKKFEDLSFWVLCEIQKVLIRLLGKAHNFNVTFSANMQAFSWHA